MHPAAAATRSVSRAKTSRTGLSLANNMTVHYSMAIDCRRSVFLRHGLPHRPLTRAKVAVRSGRRCCYVFFPSQALFSEQGLQLFPDNRMWSARFPSLRLYRCELAALLRLSAPLILAQLAQTSMGFVDTLMAGRVGARDLAAVAIGSSLWFPLILLLLGLLSALTPLMAQAQGAGQRQQLRQLPAQGMLLGGLAGLALAVLLPQSRHLLPLLQVETAVRPLIDGYLVGVAWGFPAIGVCFALRYCSEGRSLARPSMIASFIGLGVNIVANAVLVFGLLGAPALGGVGCGPATALAMWAMLLVMLLLYRRIDRAALSQWRRGWRLLDRRLQLQLLRLGLPIGIGLFIECSSFALIALLLSRFGAGEVAAHQIALNFVSLIFMIPLSISSATAVRVGFSIGRARPQQVRCAVRTAVTTALVLALTSASLMLLLAPACAALYTSDAHLRQRAAELILLAALFQLPDALQVIFAGALRGCKDTRVPMLLQTLAYWAIGLPLGCLLGLRLQQAAPGFWYGLIAGLSCAALMLGLRLRTSLRRVIAGLRPGTSNFPLTRAGAVVTD
ncbi:multidrug resistance protein, MATE family [Desulfuromonas thiophila]|uniref:Multidrug resistance protein, MATE family n=2 Tax=Desulfuromonas thiophila TaxID=57664 RepID=A0A1G6YEY7_9BACT|nr:multidrug resistance protein, MATE family [Desulfuromonas thiophila]